MLAASEACSAARSTRRRELIWSGIVGLPMALSTSLEVLTSEGWKVTGVNEAIDRDQRRGRCVECGQPVRVHRTSVNGMAAHVEHIKRNPACRLSDRR